MTQFTIGDRLRFIRNNSDGGESFGRAGEECIVVNHTPGSRRVSISLVDRPGGSYGGSSPDYRPTWGASIRDLEPVGPRIRKLSGFGQFVKRLKEEECPTIG